MRDGSWATVLSLASTLSRLVSGGYFVWTGSGKLGRMPAFWSEIMAYGITSAPQSRLLAAAIPPAEFVIGLFFAAGLLPKVTGPCLLALLLIFTIALSVSLVRHTGNDCGCGATPSPVRPRLLLRNAALASMIAVGLLAPPQHYPAAVVVAALGAAVIAVMAVANYRRFAD